VQKEENRLAAAELDIGHALAVDGEELPGVRFDAMRSGHRRFLRATVSHDSSIYLVSWPRRAEALGADHPPAPGRA